MTLGALTFFTDLLNTLSQKNHPVSQRYHSVVKNQVPLKKGEICLPTYLVIYVVIYCWFIAFK